MSTSTRWRVRGLIVLVSVAAVTAVATLPKEPLLKDPLALFCIVTLAALTGARPVRIPAIHVEVSPLEPFLFVAMIAYGGWPACLVAAITLSAAAAMRRPMPKLEKFTFNLGSLVFAAAITDRVYRFLLGRFGDGGPQDFLFPLIVAATAYFVINTALVTTVICIDRGTPFGATWMQSGLWTGVSNYTGVALGAVLYLLLDRFGTVWLAIGVPPTLLLVKFYRVHKDRIAEQESRLQEIVLLAKKADEANNSKSRFLANMSHEIRTPMNGVIGMLELLQNTRLDAKQSRYVEMARNSAGSLLGLLDDILDLSKIEAGRLRLESLEFDVREVVELTAEMFASRAHVKGLELVTQVDAAVPETVNGDPVRLRQILVNLAGNAIKFTERGEVVIRVRVEADGPEGVVLRCDITDTGIGVDPGTQARVFSVFTQGDDSTTRKFGGTGLGLAITRQLAELMGGTVGVESHDGPGSTFWFTVALKRGACAAPPSRATFPDLRVLVVDDNASCLLSLAEHLRAGGLEPRCVPESALALQEVDAAERSGRPFDIVLLDATLPEDALAAWTGALGVWGAGPAPRVFLMAPFGVPLPGSVDPESFSGVLVKPVRAAEVRRVVTAPPVRSPLEGSVDRAVRPPASSNRTRWRVLLAEDNIVNQEVACGMLEALGCSVDTVNDGVEAVEAMRRGEYDIVFMDCMMPRMDGYAATAAARREGARGRRGRLPIVALTANAMSNDRADCLAAGMDDHLAKPFRLIDLQQALSRWCDAMAERA